MWTTKAVTVRRAAVPAEVCVLASNALHHDHMQQLSLVCLQPAMGKAAAHRTVADQLW